MLIWFRFNSRLGVGVYLFDMAAIHRWNQVRLDGSLNHRSNRFADWPFPLARNLLDLLQGLR